MANGVVNPINEYMRMPTKLIPQEFINLYDSSTKVKNRYIYIEIQKDMYGLPHTDILTNKLLKDQLVDHDYYEVPHPPGLYTHKTRPIWFTSVVDDFGINHSEKEHANHLLQALRGHSTVEVDWNGLLYCGITLNWKYDDTYVAISMPNYIQKQLVHYRRRESHLKQFCPFQPASIN